MFFKWRLNTENRIQFQQREILLLLIALFFGAGIGIARTQSYSLFLINLDAIWTLPSLLLSELLYLPIVRSPRKDEKFSLTVSLTGGLFSLVFLLNLFNPSAFLSAMVYFVITVIMRNLVRWMLFEILFLHIERSRANEFSYSLSAAFDLGSLFTVAIMMMFSIPSPYLLSMVGVLWVILFAVTYFNFNNPKSYEIRLASKEFPGESWEIPLKKKVLKSYVVMTFFIGLYFCLQEYLWRNILQSADLPKSQYINYTNLYVMGSNLLGVIGGALAGWATKKSRISPDLIIKLYFLLCALSLVIYSVSPGVVSAILLGVISSGGFRSFFSSAHHTLMSCYDEVSRIYYRKWSQITLYILPIIPVFILTIVFKKISDNSNLATLQSGFKGEELFIVLGILLLVSLWQLKNYISYITDLMFIYLHSEDRVRKVTGAMLISFLRPVGYVRWLRDILQNGAKTLMIKTIIEALSFEPTRRSVKLILQQVDHPKEEIRLAVCDSLGRIKTPQSTASLMDISLNADMPQRVRAKAIHILYSRLKENLVAMYLNILRQDTVIEKKILALEALSEFHHETLSREFLDYVNHTHPEIIKHSLIGLYKNSSYRDAYEYRMKELLKNPETLQFAMALQVIGKVKDRRWFEFIVNKRPKNKVNLILKFWCLYRINGRLKKKELVLLRQLLVKSEMAIDVIKVFIHFNSDERIDILTILIKDEKLFRIGADDMVKLLKSSNLDFHEEILYLNSLNQKNSVIIPLFGKKAA